MARLYVRSGLAPDAPDADFPILVVDPDGTAGERALGRLGGHCYEGDGVFHLVRTDGWAERSLNSGLLTVGVAVHPVLLRQAGVDPADFPERSAIDPDAVLLLSAPTAADPALGARLGEPTAVFTAGPDVTLDQLLADDEEWPVMLAPPPAQPPISVS
ncbi:hypothetical protein JHN63_26345 [Streptomyces sp. MBT65]|uniref:hypothetical protein n=1 Tax=Streptomyces sp. MBT65 TaxID=1488395 RepID=UPI0019094CD2|nr:hypothetical protein [Streptomyces sp. MBT65]MBK3577258.1 hypothetical protein [Streptomyces sp. MBT65]